MRSKVLVALVLAAMIISSLPTLAPEASGGVADEIWDYPGRTKLITDFESINDEISYYGTWFLFQETGGSPSITYSKILLGNSLGIEPWVVHGDYSLRICQNDSDPNIRAVGKYQFKSNPLVDPLSIKDLSFWISPQDNHWPGQSGTSNIIIHAYSEDINNNKLEEKYFWLDINYQYQEIVLDQIYNSSAYDYTVDIQFWCDGTGETFFYIDFMTAEAPPCDVRFSFYNEYTGLGLQSELLVPEVWYGGQWIRVYDGHAVLGAGGTISYQVSDYFGQVIKMGMDVKLNASAIYLDIPVKLVKVQIAKPDWWSSSLPPEWQLMYLPTGKQIDISGWELEMIAGWYNFKWATQKVTASATNISDSDEELVVEEGSVDTYIDGNITTAHSYSLQNFFLTMKPTYSGTINGENNSIVLADLGSWDGLMASLNVLFDQIMNSTEYKAIMILGFLLTILSIVGFIRYQASQRLKKAGGNRK